MLRNQLYILLSAVCLAGYIWLAISYRGHSSGEKGTDICIFKKITGIPCPSCGSTRAVLALIKGDITNSISLNPIGLILAVIMLISPLWIIYDVLKRRSSLLWFYIRAEIFIRQKQVAIPCILLIIANWGWNIYKEL